MSGEEGVRPSIVAVVWEGEAPSIRRIKGRLGCDLELYTQTYMDSHGMSLSSLVERMRRAEVTLLHSLSKELFESLLPELEPYLQECRVISHGTASSVLISNVRPEVSAKAAEYLAVKGDENMFRLFDFLEKEFAGKPGDPLPCVSVPKDSLVSPEDGSLIANIDDYMRSFVPEGASRMVAVVGSSSAYDEDRMASERELCRALADEGVCPILFYIGYGSGPEGKAIDLCEAVKKYCFRDGSPIIGAIVKPSRCSLKHGAEGTRWIEELDIPVFQPVMLSYSSLQEWMEGDGITREVAFQVFGPELEGAISPIVMGSDIGMERSDSTVRTTLPERMRKIAARVRSVCDLRSKPNPEKKVLIVLNNFPCMGAEANVGNAIGLDALESTVRLMRSMAAVGYDVDVPSSGEDLRRTIFEKKAVSDFRWTSASDIAHSGGAMYQMDYREYREFFDSLPESNKEDMLRTWGEPPGSAMVYEGRILIPAVSFGNVTVAVQPKRGCYGSRCDGEVCRILHDPNCPPTHQFLAFYRYFETIWGADAIIDMGAHGLAENLPGKGVGLSSGCYPDIVAGSVPTIYPYCCSAGFSGLGAKRRLYAVLTSHMEPVSERTRLYGPFQELDSMLSDLSSAQGSPERSEALREMLVAKASECGFDASGPLEECVRAVREQLSRITTSFVNKGLHVLGETPSDDDLADLVASAMSSGSSEASLPGLCARIRGMDLPELVGDRGANKDAIESVYEDSRSFVDLVLRGEPAQKHFQTAYGLTPSVSQEQELAGFASRMERLCQSVRESDEIGAVLNALNGGFVPAGPSGSLADGNDRAVPSGRNLHGKGTDNMPTRTAWATGSRIADLTVERYLEEHGEHPESIGLFWMLTDHISTGGESMCQMMRLLGTEPRWEPDGKFAGYRILPLEELGRPRVDISVDISSLIRDGLRSSVDVIDSIIDEVSDLDEPLDLNPVRKHTLESIKKGLSEYESKARIFGAPPGSTSSAVSLAIYAGAWKSKKDLAEIFLSSNGYAYGGKKNGVKMMKQFANVLASVSVSVNSGVSRSTDPLDGSTILGDIGGLAAASQYLSGKKVEMYSADSSDKSDVFVEGMDARIVRATSARLFNPRCISEMKANGYRGASEIGSMVTVLFGWQSTSGAVNDKVFDKVVETYVEDRENRDFLAGSNIHALEELERRLLEAESRGLWKASEDLLEILRNDYLDLEADLEESSGDGEKQGGSVDVFTSDDLEEWRAKLSDAIEAVESFVDDAEGSVKQKRA